MCRCCWCASLGLDLERLRARLIADHEAVIEQDRLAEADRAPVALDQDSVGRLSRIDAMQVQAMALAQARRRHSKRLAIEAALQRVDTGEFGYCFKCGEAIALARLDHDPALTTCINCARGG